MSKLSSNEVDAKLAIIGKLALKFLDEKFVDSLVNRLVYRTIPDINPRQLATIERLKINSIVEGRQHYICDQCVNGKGHIIMFRMSPGTSRELRFSEAGVQLQIKLLEWFPGTVWAAENCVSLPEIRKLGIEPTRDCYLQLFLRAELGDDFPLIYDQCLAQRKSHIDIQAVIIQTYIGTYAKLEEVKRYFATQRIRIVLLN